jgi:hypothetical protein
MNTSKPRRGALKIAGWLRTFVLILSLVANFLPLAPQYTVSTALAAPSASASYSEAAAPSRAVSAASEQAPLAQTTGPGICVVDNSVACSIDQDCVDAGVGGTCVVPTGGGDVLTSADVTAATGLANTCMNDVYDAFGQGGGLNCTANDVNIASTR